MNTSGVTQIVIFAIVITACVKPLGNYMAKVYLGERTFLSPVLGPLERLIYRLCGIDANAESSWKGYAASLLLFNFIGFVVVYLLQRWQGVLPLNPQGFAGVGAESAFNTAVSFASNTNWQGYGGESTMSYLTQMLGLGVQNFVSAASGMAVLIALIRGFARRQAKLIGNFYVDMTRGTLYVLSPLSVLLAVVLVSQGVVQSFSPYQAVDLVQPGQVAQQTIPLGPAASQIAIKQLGTNGGGFF
jgi:potassium-transporting ATPase potassium-binding subunit